MATTQEIESFNGGSRKECSTFIQNVRTVARKEGKLRDPGWMADFASTYLSDEALEWYCLLPQDVQENWPKLQAALVKRWSQSCEQDESRPENEPNEATSPTTKGREKIDYLDRGILKVVVVGEEQTFYVRRIQTETVCTIQNATEAALCFRFESQPTSKLLECMNDRPYSWLAMHWNVNNPNVGRGSEHYAYLTTVESETLKSSWGNGSFQVLMCRVSNSDEVTFLWRNGNTETSMTAFTSASPASLCLTPDPQAYLQKWPTEKRVKLFMQKTN